MSLFTSAMFQEFMTLLGSWWSETHQLFKAAAISSYMCETIRLPSPELSGIVQLMDSPAQSRYCHSKHSLEEACCSHTKRQGAKSA